MVKIRNPKPRRKGEHTSTSGYTPQLSIHMEDDAFFEVDLKFDSKGRTPLNEEAPQADYSTKVYHVELKRKSSLNHLKNTEDTSKKGDLAVDPSHFKELLVDCEIADSGLMPRTFWMSANDRPRCTLEQLAQDIFLKHTTSMAFDPMRSGAEWWVQIRPSPESTGRYAMHGDPADVNEKQGVPFHYDKDEELRMICGGNTYVHPHWSTITYLTDVGAPTLILEGCRVNNLTGEWEEDVVEKSAVLSWPEQWKHLSFDGRWLHAVPANLEVIRPATPEHRRYTFLVNIWLNYKPYDVKPFPGTMLDKLSGHDETAKADCRTRLKIDWCGKKSSSIRSELCEMATSEEYIWPLGDPGSTVSVRLPRKMGLSDQAIATTRRISWPGKHNGVTKNTLENLTAR